MITLKQSAIALATASLLAAVGAAPVFAQEHCGSMYQRVMEAYQMQSPHYGQMLNYYNARCLSGSSGHPSWGGDYRRQGYEYERHDGYDNDRSRRGW